MLTGYSLRFATEVENVARSSPSVAGGTDVQIGQLMEEIGKEDANRGQCDVSLISLFQLLWPIRPAVDADGKRRAHGQFRICNARAPWNHASLNACRSF
jgi:hypothetical protein